MPNTVLGDASPSLCYEPELIPDPLADIGLKLYPQGLRRFLTMSMDLGSVL